MHKSFHKVVGERNRKYLSEIGLNRGNNSTLYQVNPFVKGV